MYLASAVAYDGEDYVFLYYFLCGVLQGEPLASVHFLLGINPFLAALKRIVQEHPVAMVRAVADDISMIAGHMRQLHDVSVAYQKFEVASLLSVKPKKCTITPVTAPLAEVARRIRELLLEMVPAWSKFAITDAFKLLGLLGPSLRPRVLDRPHAEVDSTFFLYCVCQVAAVYGHLAS